ncbi:DHA2 family efflux MFS transporter permease subunit [Luteipulveratus mongoliensis]|uniref:Major facilitator superfamily (MFS) profile domain-containing protein n=1 Tax=Luteipulveratus mongoliensis TaxID=571913 RepID=A0A0K1JFL1_9MICO|nr:DHA2 family efflux MFS transporter permease subunit [Luteipulveratus mongoliensis]AKU15491.1 hypothetical protein VV02_05775 [Luteipulveratus mongoliensis]
MTTMTAESEASPPRSAHRYRWLVLAVILVADVMDLVDATVLNLAIPSIQTDLHISGSSAQWLLAAYTMTFAIGLVTSARIGDVLGRRELFLIGMAGFTVVSLACALAPGAGWLIALRALQGLFGAVMIPQGLALVKAAFPPEELAKAFVPFGPIMGLSAVLGPILAGFLLDANLFGSQWRSIFFINVPIGIAAFVMAARALPRIERQPGARLDIGGMALLTVASTMLIYPLVQGREAGWPWWAYALIAGSLVLFGAFAISERRSRHPVIEPSLFANRGFVVGLCVLAAFFSAMTGFMLAFNLHLQGGLHFSPLHAGLTLVPWALGTSLGAVAGGVYLAERLGRASLHLGLAIATAGMVGLWWTVEHFGADLTSWQLVPATLVIGFGLGQVFVPLFGFVLGDLDDRQVGTGSGLLNAVQQFFGAIGVAALGTLFFQRLPAHGFVDTTGLVIAASAVLFVITFGLVFALPRTARGGSGGSGGEGVAQ